MHHAQAASRTAPAQNRPRERIVPQPLADQGGETIGTFAEVYRLRGHQHPHPRRDRDHVAALTARSTSRSQPRSIPLSARTVAPAISITIDPGPFAGALAAPTSWLATMTGTNMGACSAGRLSRPVRAALRQAKRCCGVISCRHRSGGIGFCNDPALVL